MISAQWSNQVHSVTDGGTQEYFLRTKPSFNEVSVLAYAMGHFSFS